MVTQFEASLKQSQTTTKTPPVQSLSQRQCTPNFLFQTSTGVNGQQIRMNGG